jgi:hypothetical protein
MKTSEDPTWPLLFKLVLALGALCSRRKGGQTDECVSIADQLFAQVLGSLHFLFVEVKMLNVQAMFLTVRIPLLRKTLLLVLT